MQKVVKDIEALEAEAATFVTSLTPREEGATLVTLSGELGAGKTAFVKAAAKALGVDSVVNSPTFVLEKIYALPAGKHSRFKNLIHIDAYRLEGGAELSPLGFDAVMENSGNLVFLEWPERVKDGLREPVAHLTLRMAEDGSREITYG